MDQLKKVYQLSISIRYPFSGLKIQVNQGKERDRKEYQELA